MNTLFSVCFFFFFLLSFSYTFHKGCFVLLFFFFLAVRTFLSICWRHFIFFYVLCFCYSLSFPRHRYLCSVLIFSVGSCDRWRKILKDKKKKKHSRHLNVTPLHTPRNAAFFFCLFVFVLLLSVLFPTVQIHVYEGETFPRGQFKLKYGDTGIQNKLLDGMVAHAWSP